jgi:synaptobrevin family protein YKT6
MPTNAGTVKEQCAVLIFHRRFLLGFCSKWRDVKEDFKCKQPRLEPLLLEYQDPAKVDKISKMDKQLAETKDILYKTIDAVLARGETLDGLVEKSTHLSQQSKLFYKQAKKTNSCCVVM